ncbi:fibrinogen-like protein 1 [Engystomops pustulosus]|uniref:fibrinogen-like protein 1 n=1 Tax=Engystomops pustulosus TaxID=76066 RepID=UPI003AFB0FA1
MAATNLLPCLLLAGLYYLQTISLVQAQAIHGYDCSYIWKRNKLTTSGLYRIKPLGADLSFQVYCKMSKDGGWTLIQRHDGTDGLSFSRTWKEYENGFGKLQGEHWLGLKYIYALTHQTGRPAKLHITLGDFNGREAYAEYKPFSVGNRSSFYKLLAGDYSGTAGDAFLGDAEVNGTSQHRSSFSSEDVVNDNCHPKCKYGDIMYLSCSRLYQGGWWYNNCGSANLNGIWRPAPRHRHRTSCVSWPTWRPDESLKFSKMYIIH